MKKITKIIKKVAGHTGKAVLLGALVGGVSMMSYATGTLEKAGPTRDKVEAAKLQTAQQSLDVVVAAIAKADPNWVKGLPLMSEKFNAFTRVPETKKVQTTTFALTGTDPLQASSYEHAPAPPNCQSGQEEICYITAEVSNPGDPEEDWLPSMTPALQDEIEDILETPVSQREDTQNVKLRAE